MSETGRVRHFGLRHCACGVLFRPQSSTHRHCDYCATHIRNEQNRQYRALHPSAHNEVRHYCLCTADELAREILDTAGRARQQHALSWSVGEAYKQQHRASLFPAHKP